jgi:hypothetical protein
MRGEERPAEAVEALTSLGQELRDREDLRLGLHWLGVRRGQQRRDGGPGHSGTGALD